MRSLDRVGWQDAQTFFKKWAQLGGPPREVKQVIKGKEPIDVPTMKDKVGLDCGALCRQQPPPPNCRARGLLESAVIPETSLSLSLCLHIS